MRYRGHRELLMRRGRAARAPYPCQGEKPSRTSMPTANSIDMRAARNDDPNNDSARPR